MILFVPTFPAATATAAFTRVCTSELKLAGENNARLSVIVTTYGSSVDGVAVMEGELLD
jgi:hypothetical protein